MMVLMPSEASSWLAAVPIAGGDLEPYRQRRNEPKQRGATASTEMMFLVVVAGKRRKLLEKWSEALVNQGKTRASATAYLMG